MKDFMDGIIFRGSIPKRPINSVEVSTISIDWSGPLNTSSNAGLFMSPRYHPRCLIFLNNGNIASDTCMQRHCCTQTSKCSKRGGATTKSSKVSLSHIRRSDIEIRLGKWREERSLKSLATSFASTHWRERLRIRKDSPKSGTRAR